MRIKFALLSMLNMLRFIALIEGILILGDTLRHSYHISRGHPQTHLSHFLGTPSDTSITFPLNLTFPVDHAPVPFMR